MWEDVCLVEITSMYVMINAVAWNNSLWRNYKVLAVNRKIFFFSFCKREGNLLSYNGKKLSYQKFISERTFADEVWKRIDWIRKCKKQTTLSTAPFSVYKSSSEFCLSFDLQSLVVTKFWKKENKQQPKISTILRKNKVLPYY